MKEIVLEKQYLEGERIKSIYFGGGTPSLLSTDEIAKLLQEIHKNFNVSTDVEITLEANPDDITNEKLLPFICNPLSLSKQDEVKTPVLTDIYFNKLQF